MEDTKKTKVKWSMVCQSKESGGMGITDLVLLNNAYITKNIWDICRLQECLWVKWMHTVILKGKSI